MTRTLITGTSTGIGLATALHLARRGHRVYATMRDLSRAAELRHAISKEGLPVEVVKLDVTNEASVQAAIEQVLDRDGGIDVLINNAGVAPFNAIELASEAEVRAVFETNVLGPLRTIRATLPCMRRQRSGKIVNISSVAGRVAASCMGIYSASKFALESISESLAREVYPFGIRVLIIEPGIIVTPILDKALESLRRSEESPYEAAARRIRALFAEGQKAGGSPQLVAEVIENALGAAEPKLRYVAGEDAAVLINGRTRMTDEEWIAMERHATDEGYYAEFTSRFPMPTRG
jgi:NAD(P)-dependent dehydrogenase (short-subunit alcohol dehydrogenase family)